jgi:hypothetical protein
MADTLTPEIEATFPIDELTFTRDRAMMLCARAMNAARTIDDAPDAWPDVVERAKKLAAEISATKPHESIVPLLIAALSSRSSQDGEAMREALEHAAHVFRVYAEIHDRKGTNEGREKARRNMEHAERMEAALSPKEPNNG